MITLLICLFVLFAFIRSMNKANAKRHIDQYRSIKIERSRREFRAMARKYP